MAGRRKRASWCGKRDRKNVPDKAETSGCERLESGKGKEGRRASRVGRRR